jgi:predicted nuclease with TOPRIM domain
MSDDERLSNLQEFAGLMAQWAQRAEERLDEWQKRMSELSAAQANSEAKIAALADAQIKTEGVVSALGEQMRELAVAQTHTDQRLDALIDIVRGMQQGNSPQQS